VHPFEGRFGRDQLSGIAAGLGWDDTPTLMSERSR